MGEESSVKLIGAWFSPFSFSIICGLELKGIKYDYIEEDLVSKSEMLLKYNPIYKKIPVFVHCGKPTLESMVILEYIEEMLPDNYPLLPKDPYQKSIARFWIKFIEEKRVSFATFFKTSGEEHEKTKGEISEILKTIEEQSGIGDANKMFFGGDSINAVDLAFASIAYWFGAMEESMDYNVVKMPQTLGKRSKCPNPLLLPIIVKMGHFDHS
ncbi:probable glutathione S-transferase [Papaver somniferum]|uniref:probable glutathione S-transferase n=1 Tax=Papaver somniferum TaxID=3469 RepID=UPI000E701558|nr:probable glutathione S-transferase [Papaver somniferum]